MPPDQVTPVQDPKTTMHITGLVTMDIQMADPQVEIILQPEQHALPFILTGREIFISVLSRTVTGSREKTGLGLR
jgi:hypothetical protein